MVSDPRTLFFVHGSTALAVGGMFFAFWHAHRTMSCLALWAGGVTLVGIGTMLVALRDEIPDLISIIMANGLIIAGAIIVWNGIRVFNARRPKWRLLMVAFPLLTLSLAYWTYVDNDLTIRIVIVAGTIAATSFMCTDELLRRGRRPLSRMTMLAGAPLLLDGIVLAGRAISAVLYPPTHGALEAGSSMMLIPLVGRILTAFGFVTITAERYIEQRRELETQLFQSQKMEALGTLAGGIAHDLNNVLVPILALAKTTAKRLAKGSSERTNLDTILLASERARDLVHQILTFSRGDASAQEPVDLARITEQALKLLRASVPSTINVEGRIGAVPLLRGDRSKLHQVVINLVTNAAQAIGTRNGTIIVEVVQPRVEGLPADWQFAGASTVCLTVSDTGCGMDQRTAARIFDPFFTTKPVGAGTGLGLSIVHGIVEQHGGRIAMESTVGQGTRFNVYLPALAAD